MVRDRRPRRLRWLLPPAVAGLMLLVAQACADRAVVLPWAVSATFGMWVVRRHDWVVPRSRIVLLPPACAAAGVAFAHLRVPAWLAAALALTVGLGLLQAASCRIGPLVSAAVLPALLGVQTWFYPLAVLAAAVVLAVLAPAPARPFVGRRWSVPTLLALWGSAVGWLVPAGVLPAPRSAALSAARVEDVARGVDEAEDGG